MSYCYDTMSKAFARIAGHLPKEERESELVMRFGFLIDEMHEANHRLKDAINKDHRVTNCARRLDNLMEGRDHD